MGYSLAASMRTLLACPFCREMFEPGEAKACPSCGLALRRLDDLPTTTVVGDEALPEPSADDETLPWTYAARGRGPLVVLAVLGMAAFFLPWVHEVAPERRALSGPEIARHLGWMWAPLVSFMVMLPLVLSRRSIARMRGARVAVAFLAAMALMTAAVRALFPPARNSLDPHLLEWGVGLYATGVIALASIVVAVRFGGPADPRAPKRPRDDD